MTTVDSNLNFFILCLLLASCSLVYTSNKDCSVGPCFPSSGEIASKFLVQANSTCGDGAVEEYCLPSSLDCSQICNASHPNQSHPATYINDAFALKTFWKSVNMDRPVFLQFDFGEQFMVYRSVVTFQFELPAAMYFAKSQDGLNFQPLAFYATDCSRFFNMTETPSNRKDGLAVECYKIDPTNNPAKQIEYGPMRDPDISQGITTNHQNQTYFVMTSIRVVLVSYITPPGFDLATASEQLKKSLSFTVQDWDVVAACFCNGQASKCDSQNIGKCLCERNTDGNNCEKCLPLYNNKTYEVRKPCEACGCNDHAASCHYDPTKGYGVCDNCTENTMGDKCETCQIEHYRPQTNLSYPCLACACNLSGVSNTANRTLCHRTTGQCDCKERVMGRACDTCKPTYWNLTESNPLGCEGCECSLIGTVNRSNTCDHANGGQCPCKRNIDGRTCNKCKDGYFNLTEDNPDGCLSCNCNPAGSVNVTCDSTGTCTCRPRFYGLKCENIEGGYFVPSVDSLTLQAEDGVLSPVQEKRVSHSMLNTSTGKEYLFVGLVLKESNNVTTPTQLKMTVTVPKTELYTFSLRYRATQNWHFLKLTVELRSIFTPFTCNGVTYSSNKPHEFLANATAGNESVMFGQATCLREGNYVVTLELRPGGSTPDAEITVDSVVILPAVTQYPQFQRASLDERTNVTAYYRWASNLRQWTANSDLGCNALSGYYGYLYGEGQACSCNSTGANNPSVCDRCGGQCSCKSNVIGRMCEKCRPDYYNFTSGSGCQACSCHVQGSNRSSCHPLSGLCECRPNVIGKQCDQCVQNYFNINSGSGCYPCNCNSNYSTSLQCNDDGVCPCKGGVGGAKCTLCGDSFFNLTTSGCTGCNCDPDGSQNLVCNKTTGQCPCRKNSVGKTCDTCQTGYYGLRAPYTDGCLKCHCSNKTNNCSTAQGWFKAELKTELLTTVDNSNMGGWQVVTADGQIVTTARWDWDVKYPPNLSSRLKNRRNDIHIPSVGFGFYPSNITLFGSECLWGLIRTVVDEEQYFSAPDNYTGQGRFAYTYNMSFKLQQDNVTSPDNSTKGDVILNGTGFRQPIVYRLPSPPTTSFKVYTINFVETDPNWHVGNTLGRRPTSDELMAVLSTLQYLYIRAKWTTYTDKTTRLADIYMGYSNHSSRGDKAENVETCRCPKEYVGQFCEQCAPGYTRVTPNGGAYVDCVPCSCNSHTDSCHRETGVCLGCQHNTTGDHCERCEDSLYGNATNGTPNDCKPCPCPGGPFATNQFSPTCYLGSDGQPTCDNCTTGHGGLRCENCVHGYYGRPQEPNGQCRVCNCNDNVDTSKPGNCNTSTGQCYNCSYNTSGYNCEWCKPGYYGNALNRTCKRCPCNSNGTRSDVPCNNVTGQCACHPNVIGLTCDRCKENTFNHSSGVGCSECNCHLQGAVSQQCNLTTGICNCHPNVTGDKCNKCKLDYYDVTRRCVACDCVNEYTNSSYLTNTTSSCDGVSGQCYCRKSLGYGNYGGRQCEQCEVHSYANCTNCTGEYTCTKCTQPCYFNWYKLIQSERNKASILSANVTEMLRDFGGYSVNYINSTIQEMKQNLTYAENVFKESAKYNTKEKQDQLERIRKSIENLEHRLNQTEQTLKEAEGYLKNTVSKFNGTVQVVPALPDHSSPVVEYDPSGSKVYADWVTLTAMATAYHNNALQLNESGHTSYRNITSSYETIKLANETAALAASQISDAMSRLTQISTRRAEVERRLGLTFQEELRNNSQLLEQIRKLSNEINSLLSSAVAKGNDANATAREAETSIKTAYTTATQRKAEAEKALNDSRNASTRATQVKAEATTAQSTTAEFKANASAVLDQAKSALDNVTQGINTIAGVHNKSRDSKATADRVIAKTIPVSLETIQDLANQIKAIEVNNSLINQTYDGAAEGLKQAKQVEALSERAINVSQTTLNKVESIEKAVEDARTSRAETERLQKQTDDQVQKIKNTTQSVQSKFTEAAKIGEETLRMINNTLSTVDNGLKCYNDSKRIAKEAALTAERAYNLAKEAQKVNETVNAGIKEAGTQVDKLYTVAKANYTEIVKAHNDSVQLSNDVREAEVLLNDYIKQRKEMERLKAETEGLETELDSLIREFDEETQKYSKCNGGS